MTQADKIQIAILVVLGLTLVASLVAQVYQIMLARANLLACRTDMYRWVHSAITQDDLADCHAYPEMIMARARFDDAYRDKPEALRRYLKLSRIYEYLALAHILEQYKVADSFGIAWGRTWGKVLMDDDMFKEVDEYYRPFYTPFSESLRRT